MAVEKEAPNNEIGIVVKLLIEAAGGDYTSVAKLLGVHPSSLSRRLVGHQEFRATELQAIATHFGVPVSVLFTRPMDLFRGSRNLGMKDTAGQRVDLSLVHGTGEGSSVRQLPLLLGYAHTASTAE